MVPTNAPIPQTKPMLLKTAFILANFNLWYPFGSSDQWNVPSSFTIVCYVVDVRISYSFLYIEDSITLRVLDLFNFLTLFLHFLQTSNI